MAPLAEEKMLSKCANPSCSTPFVYLREGKIFIMDPNQQMRLRKEGPVLVRHEKRVEHFWLCGPCSAEMTIVHEPSQGIKVVPKKGKIARKAAAS
jgi:hypothetical protein